jgi:hypothetical protein
MATLEFECPQCGQICAFDDRHVGRRARCTKCNALFLIPAAGQPAHTLKQAILDDGPFSGFWTALLRDTPKALLHPHSLAGILLMVCASVVRFYIGHPMLVVLIFLFIPIPLPVGIFATVITVGFQSRYLFDIIQSAADHDDPLPWALEGTYAERLFQSIVGAYSLLVLTAASLAPAGLMWFILKKAKVEADWPVMVAAAVGLFFLPLMLTIYAYSRDLLLSFRLNVVLRAARKAFWPHMVLVGLMLAIAAMLWQSFFYARNAPPQTLFQNAVLHGLAAGLSVLTARAAGLFYRHYGCYLP